MRTARQLRNRVITILDRDDAMQTAEVFMDEQDTFPAIVLKQGGRTFVILFAEAKEPDAKETARSRSNGA